MVQKIAGKHSGFLPHPYFTQNGKVKFVALVLLLLYGDKNEIKIAMKFSVDPETPKNSLIKNVALIILTFNKFSKTFLACRKTSGRHGSRLVKPFINLRQSRSFLLKIEVSVA